MTEKARRQRKKAEGKEQTFEQALARLEEIAARLESGELALEEAIALAEEGLKLRYGLHFRLHGMVII